MSARTRALLRPRRRTCSLRVTNDLRRPRPKGPGCGWLEDSAVGEALRIRSRVPWNDGTVRRTAPCRGTVGRGGCAWNRSHAEEEVSAAAQ
jgi:hypothetical protein